MDTTDVSNCELEPIRFPGAVLPHGALLVLQPKSGVIEAASESCRDLLGVSPENLLGQPIGQLVGSAPEIALQLAAKDGQLPPIQIALNNRNLKVRQFVNDAQQVLVDIETSDQDSSLITELLYQCRRNLTTLRQQTEVVPIAQYAADLIRGVTGFDRVMFYRFDEAWNGEIIAESRVDDIEPYLGLNFPASDIPKQARELFQLSKVRLIPDVLYTPSDLVSRRNTRSIDLGRSSLRSVSPIHIEYLKNMGVRASLVSALMVNGRLWGLVACHQTDGPKYFSPDERDILGWHFEDIAALLETALTKKRREMEYGLAVSRRKLVNEVRVNGLSNLIHQRICEDLLDVVHADGFALISDNSIQSIGSTPTLGRIREMQRRRLERQTVTTWYSSNALTRDLGISEVGDGVSGAVFISLHDKPEITMVWYRNERSHSVAWAGDPERPHVVDESGRLSPRKSFAQFVQAVRGQSLAWTPEELDSAIELGGLIEIEMLRQKEAFAQSILNSITEHLVVLDSQGVVVSVNDAWKRFAINNSGEDFAENPIGLNYRSVCATASCRPDGIDAGYAWAGIEAVLNKRQEYFTLDYSCDAPNEARWFSMRVYPMAAPCNGAVVAHADITERKLVELNLSNSERRFRNLFALNNAIILQIDPDNGQILDANAAALTFYGWSHEEIVSKSIQDINELDPAQVAAEYAAASRGERSYFIFPHRLANGETRTVEVHSTPIPFGNRILLVSIIHDITEQVRDKRQVENLIHEQKAIIESRVIGMARATGRIIAWTNSAFSEMLGYTEEELVGQSTHMFYISEDAYFTLGEAAYPIIRRGEIFRSEIQFRRKNGSLGWYEVGGGMLNQETEESIWVFVDISERKQIEITLANNEARLKSIFAGMAEGLLIQGKDGRVIDANPAAEEIFGLTRNQLMSRTSIDPLWQAVREDGSLFPGDEHPTMVTLRTGRSLRNQIMGIHTPGGNQRWISINSAPFFSMGEATPDAVVTTFIDITKLRQTLLQLSDAKTHLENIASIQAAYLVQLAGELTLAEQGERDRLYERLHGDLQPLLVAVRLMLSSLDIRTSPEYAMRVVAEACEHVSQGIKVARNLSFELSPPLIRERGLNSALESLFRWLKDSFGLTVDFVTIPVVVPNSDALLLLCFNAVRELLMNIIKHAGTHNAKVSVMPADNDFLNISVSDDGNGFDPDIIPIGTGLAGITRRLTMFGGSIQIDSLVGEGTIVTLSLPLRNKTTNHLARECSDWVERG